jgi:hypothetical protein
VGAFFDGFVDVGEIGAEAGDGVDDTGSEGAVLRGVSDCQKEKWLGWEGLAPIL